MLYYSLYKRLRL